MKKNWKAFLLAVVMVLSTALFAACGETSTSENGGNGNTEAPLSAEADYKVTVVDVTGTPCADVTAVKFMQNGQQVAMQLVKDGSAVKKMTRGDYTVELQFGNTESNFVYDAEAAKLTKETTEVQIIVSQTLGEEYVDLYVGETGHKAYFVSVGGTNITLASARSYYIFAPTQAGLYEFSLTGSSASIGYYGGTHFVQSVSAVEVKDNKFSLSVSEGNLGSSYVIGVDAGEGDAILGICRVGDPNWSVDQEPWTVYNPTHTPTPYTLPAGTKLNEFDLTAATDTYKLVLNESEGFYHLNSADGPLVLVKIGKTDADTQTENQSNLPVFEVMLENSGVRRYFFDDDGNFLKKEEYSNCLLTYIENVDEASGMYPLTEDLMYIIQQQGIQAGWWSEEREGTYLFLDANGNKLPGINNEIAWLFMCRYAG